MPPPMDQAGGSPGLMQLLAQLQSGGGGMPPGPPMGGMPPGLMGPPEAAEGESGQNPLIMLLMSLLAGQGGGMPPGMPPGGPPPAMAGGGY